MVETKERPFFVKNTRAIYALKFWLKERPAFDAHVLRQPAPPDKPHHAIGLHFYGGSATYQKCGLILIIEPALVQETVELCESFAVPRARTYDDDLRASDDGMAEPPERMQVATTYCPQCGTTYPVTAPHRC